MIHLVHLYPKEMNIYGDTGNRLVLEKRMQWRGIQYKTSFVGVGQKIPADASIIIGGGGQDAGQEVVQHDLKTKAKDLHMLAQKGVVMLMVCGMYQLFGSRFVTNEGEEIKGISLLPIETVGGKNRMIGNTLYETEWGKIVGYENHSGVTTLDEGGEPFAKVITGSGNNGKDLSEGCRLNNVFGTYSHGPILAKNPKLADEMIRIAAGLERLKPLDDTLERKASEEAQKRPR